MKKIILFGPKKIEKKTVYGGGEGGYTRNMAAYSRAFKTDQFEVTPCYHSVRGQYHFSVFTPIIRMLSDMSVLIRSILKQKPTAVHILAQYRDALARELMVTIISRLFGLKIIYDIKAGSFAHSYLTRPALYRTSMKYIVHSADLVLVEGRSDIDFIQKQFNKEARFFPNFVLKDEIPPYKPTFTQEERQLKILFVGFAYRNKGVFELIQAISSLHNEIPLELTIVGEEHPDFAAYLDSTLRDNPSMVVHRLGVLRHKDVLSQMSKHNIYAYPTTHPGEGHNNSINEAMMNSLNIVTTYHGFLYDILGDHSAHHIKTVTPETLYQKLKDIWMFPDRANDMTKNAYQKLCNEYSSDTALSRLTDYYRSIII